MSEEGYNGWKNYPTWAVNLWLSNEQDSYNECVRMAAHGVRHSAYPRAYMADALKALHKDSIPEAFVNGDAGVFQDLLGYALDCVEWYEIADAFLAEVEVSA